MMLTSESTIIRAVKRLDKRLLEVILPRNTQFGSRDANGKTALMIAAEQDNLHFCNLLVEKEHYFLTSDGKNALILAVESGSSHVIPILAQRCSYVQDSSGRCALSYAAQAGDLSMCKLLITNCHLRDIDYDRALKFLRMECKKSEEQSRIEQLLTQSCKTNKGNDLAAPLAMGVRSISSGFNKAPVTKSDTSLPPTIVIQKTKGLYDDGRQEQGLSSLGKNTIRASSIGAFSGTRLVTDSSRSLDHVMEKIEIEKLQSENARLKTALSALTTEKQEEKELMEKKLQDYKQRLYDIESATAATEITETEAQQSVSDKGPNTQGLVELQNQLDNYKTILQKKDQEITILRRLVETNYFMKDLDEKLLLLSTKSNKTEEKLDTIRSTNSSCVSATASDKGKLSLSLSTGQIDESVRMSDLKDPTTVGTETSHAESISSQRNGSQMTHSMYLIPLLNEYQIQLDSNADILAYYQKIFRKQVELGCHTSLSVVISSSERNDDSIINNLRELLALRTAGMNRAINLVQEKDTVIRALLQQHTDAVRRNMKLQAELWKRKRTLLHIELKDLLDKYTISNTELEMSRFKALIEEMHNEVRLLSNTLVNEKKELKVFKDACDKYLKLYYEEQQKNTKLENDVLILKQDLYTTRSELERLSSQLVDHNIDKKQSVQSSYENYNSKQISNNQEDILLPISNKQLESPKDLTVSLERVTDTSISDICEGCIELNKELSQLKTDLRRVQNINEGLTHKNELLVKDLETVIHEIDPEFNVRRIYAKGKLSTSKCTWETPQELNIIRNRIKSMTLENPPLSVRMEQPITSKLLRDPGDRFPANSNRSVTDMWTQTFNLSVPIEDEHTYTMPAISPAYKLLPNILQPNCDQVSDNVDHSISMIPPHSQNATMLYLNTTSRDQSIQHIDGKSPSEDITILHNPLQSSVFHVTSPENTKELDICSEEKLDEKLGLYKKPRSQSNVLTQKLSNLLKEAIEVPPPPLPSSQHSTRARSRRIINTKDTKDNSDSKVSKQPKVKEGKRDTLRLTPLMIAVQQKDIAGVSNNLQYVKVATANGMTALMFAAEYGFIEAVKLLAPMESGICAPNNETALIMALRAGHINVAEILTPYEGIKLSRVNLANDRFTELMKAAKNNNIGMVWALVGYQKRLQDDSKRTALMYAADAGNFDACRILSTFEAGMSTTTGDTALMMAVINQHTRIVELLLPLEAGHHGNKLTNVGKGYTALQLSVYYGHYDLVQLLYQKERHILDADGRSCLYYAKHCSSRVSRETKEAIITYFTTESS